MPEKAPALGKFLASSEKNVRDRAVGLLSKFLSGTSSTPDELQEEEYMNRLWAEKVHDKSEWLAGDFKLDARLEPLEMAKLWQGVYFCFYMSDKPLVQQALADNLALLALDVKPKKKKGADKAASSYELYGGRVARFRSALSYIAGFWGAMRREWTTLDKHRLDKFLLLTRRFIHVSFLLLAREHWEEGPIEAYNAFLVGPGGPLDMADQKTPHSLSYHIADIYVEELEKSISAPLKDVQVEKEDNALPLNLLMSPMLHSMAHAPSKALYKRIQENAVEPLLKEGLPKKEDHPSKRRRTENEEEASSLYPGIFEHAIIETENVTDSTERKRLVASSLLKEVFRIASQKDTNDSSRRKMYEFYRQNE